MEKIYSKQQNNSCGLAKASTETVQFLLSFSKSMHVVNYKEMQFENILN